MSNGDFSMPGGYRGISSLFNFTRGAIDASKADKPMDQMMAFKSTGLDLAGEATQYLKPCSKFSKFLPFVGKAVSINDGRMAWNDLQAEKAKPQPDPVKISMHQRNLAVAMVDTVSPGLPMGTAASTLIDVGTFIVKNPPVFTSPSSSMMEMNGFHPAWAM